MKKNYLIPFFSFLLFFVISSCNYEIKKKDDEVKVNKVSIEDILEQERRYIDELVIIKGFITQYTPETAQTTANYIVRGEYGATIKVNTSSNQPRINQEYRIKGIVKIDDYNRMPYIIEMSKAMLIPVWIYIAGGAFLVLIVVLIIVLSNSRRKAGGTTPSARKYESPGAEPTYDSSYKTVEIVTDPKQKKTMVWIPGKLVFQNGQDKGKEIKLSGYPGENGSAIVSIGNREEKGDRKSAHIRLMEETVSREQAELIYFNQDKKLLLKNLSKTNYSRVNGEEILPNMTKEIANGDTIKTGQLEFKYIGE